MTFAFVSAGLDVPLAWWEWRFLGDNAIFSWLTALQFPLPLGPFSKDIWAGREVQEFRPTAI